MVKFETIKVFDTLYFPTDRDPVSGEFRYHQLWVALEATNDSYHRFILGSNDVWPEFAPGVREWLEDILRVSGVKEKESVLLHIWW